MPNAPSNIAAKNHSYGDNVNDVTARRDDGKFGDDDDARVAESPTGWEPMRTEGTDGGRLFMGRSLSHVKPIPT
jgi:hypothetical protein